MPAIKLKKVTAEYIAQKEKEGKEKNEKKNLEDMADEGESDKDEEDQKEYNFLDVKIIYDKRKRTLPVADQKLSEWLDDNLEKKEDVNLNMLSLYEYYTETCQLQGVNVVDIPVFNRYMREKFGKMFGFKDGSPYKGLLKERKIKEKKPHVQGETLGLKIKNIIQDVITTAGNPKKGLRFNSLKMGINAKYPALRVDLYPKKLRSALERGIRYGHIQLVKGAGMCGFYRLPGESTLEEDKEEKKDKKKKKPEGEEGGEDAEKKEGEVAENGADSSETDDSKTEESGTKRKLEEGEGQEGEGEPPKKKQKKKKKSKKASEKKMWARGEAAKHSDPHKVEEALPLAITYQSDPKEASGSRIKQYITQHYGDCNIDKLKKSLESGIDKGLWELTRGSGMSGMYHLLIDTFNPSRSDTMDDRIAQAIVASHEPKQASALLIKKYISEYHPKLNIDIKPHLFKHALERANNKGFIRQITGIGASGSFMLVDHFYPSPAILAGEPEDEKEIFAQDDDDDDNVVGELYVPRPTKRSGRKPVKPEPAFRPKTDRSAPPKKKASKPAAKPSPAKKTKSKGGKVTPKSKPKKTPARVVAPPLSDEESSDEELGDFYTPRPTSRGRGGPGPVSSKKATPAKKAAPAKEEPPAKKSKVAAGKGKAKGAKASTPVKAKSAKKRR